MALVSNKHAGLGLVAAGAAFVVLSLVEARADLASVHPKLWIAGPTFLVLGVTMARHPGAGPVGEDGAPALTPRERRLWIVAGVVGVLLGTGWLLLLAPL